MSFAPQNPQLFSNYQHTAQIGMLKSSAYGQNHIRQPTHLAYRNSKSINVDTFGEVRLKIGIKKLALIKWYIGGNYKNFIKF